MIAAMTTPAPWTRERVKRYLVQRFYTRFHMSLILTSSGLAAMLASAGLLWLGVTAMLVRYPIAITLAYLTFLGGVALWIRYVGLRDESGAGRSLLESADIPDIGTSGRGGSGSGSLGGLGRGGGSFDGGGASSSWVEGARAPAMPANVQAQAFAVASAPDGAADSPIVSTTTGGGKGISGGDSGGGDSGGGGSGGSGRDSGSSSFSLGDIGDLDGEAIVLLILALAAIAAIFFASGYLVWFAPDILTEAAFGAMLAGGLVRRSKREDAEGWVAGVVKKTWWPFALVLAVALVFAGYSAAHYPAARTFKEAVSMALGA